jgi:hypothetical protein
MKKLKTADALEYLRNCYAKVDGLWFIKAEEELGFEKALEFDRKVWAVLPKIQARFLKNAVQNEKSDKKYTPALRNPAVIQSVIPDEKEFKLLRDCLAIKMKFDGFLFKTKLLKEVKSRNTRGIIITINKCPWHEIMVKSKREKLSSRIGSVICHTEYSAFAGEFSDNIYLNINEGICRNHSTCSFYYEKK